MDVLTTGAIALTVCAAVAFVLYKLWNKDEDTFAKARANKQITLLDDVAPKKKNDDKKEKEKQQKKKEEKKKKAAASVDSKEDKPAAPAAAPAPVPEEQPKPAAQPAKKEQPKPEEPKKKETPAKAAAAAAAPVAEPVAVKKEEAAPLQTAAPEQKKSAQQPNGEKKANKKAAAPKQVEEIENEEEFVEAKTKKAKKTEKKEAAPAPAVNESTAPRHLSLKDLDTNKVVTRLSSIDEIEVEYIEYLNNFFRDTATNAAKALTDSARAARLAEENARALHTVKTEKAKLEGELDANRRLTHELATKAAAAGSVEQELKSKLAALAPEMDKLRRDLEASRKAAAAVVIPVVPDNKEELEKLKADAKTASARVAELEEQLKAAKEAAAKERKQHEQSVLLQKTREDAAVGQEVLLAESRQNAKAISQRLTELEQVKETLEQRVAEATKQADELKEQADKREATHAADTQSLKTMIEELNKEVHRFEEAKKEQTEMVAKLAAKEAELVKKSEALKAAELQISEIQKGSDVAGQSAAAEIKTLTTRVAELEKALAEEQKRAAEVVIPVAEPKKEEQVEEVVELKKSAYLNAAPPAVDNSEELEALKQENADLKKEQTRLQEKNSELRTKSHAMVDQLSAMEKRFVANGVAASTSAAPAAPAAEEKSGSKKSKKGGAEKKEAAPAAAAAAPKEEKKGDEEERVRAERRLVQAHIGKLIGGATPALDDAADAKAYEQWLKSVGAALKEAQEKAKKEAEEAAAKKAKKTQPAPAPVVDDDAEKEQLRAENEKFREAFATLEDELQTIEQLKTEREESYIRRIAELEKTHDQTQIAEVRSAMDALPALTVPAAASAAVAATPAAAAAAGHHSPPTSQSEDDGSWEVVA